MKRGNIRFGLLFVAVFLFCGQFTFAQQLERPQNIYRVTVNSRYVLKDGKRLSEFYAINQLIYDSLGRLHHEIDYDWETHVPNNYRWNYFIGIQKARTDFFIHEKMDRREDYTYSADNRLQSLALYKPHASDTLLVVKEVYVFDAQGKVQKAMGYDARGKKRYTTQFKYDEQGNEVFRRVKGKRLTPPDSILRLERQLEYDSLNRVVAEQLVVQKAQKPKTTFSYEYAYDKHEKVAEKKIKSSDGELIKRKVFVRRGDGKLQRMEVFDGEGNLIDYQAWRYEIYKSAQRRHRMLE